MNKLSCLFFMALFTISCHTEKKGAVVCYQNKRAIETIRWSEAMIGTSHLTLRKNNYFNYYQTLLWAYKKEVEYRGTYRQHNDTIFFQFCSDTAHKWLTDKAFVDKTKGKITLVNPNPRLNKIFNIR